MCGRSWTAPRSAIEHAVLTAVGKPLTIGQHAGAAFESTQIVPGNVIPIIVEPMTLSSATWEINGYYNARLDTYMRPSNVWKSLTSTHCLIPLVGFYEGSHQFISPTGDILFAGGLVNLHQDPQGHYSRNVVMVTEDASSFVLPYHRRQPYFLSSENAELWLSGFISVGRYTPALRVAA